MSLRAARSWTGVCVLITVVGIAFNLRGSGPGEPGSEQAVGEPTVQVRTASVVGVAEVSRDGEETWAALEPGQELSKGDQVRTGDFSQVILRPRHGAVLTLTPNTSFTIGDETPEVSRFSLGVGRVSADVERRRERRFEFESSGGSARADTRGGEFHIIADEEGLLGVVTHRGEVGLAAEGQRVNVPAGRQAVVLPGKPPGEPLAIPEEVFLQVQWPEEELDEDEVTVAGRTDVGTRIRMGDTTVPVDHDGSFEVDVPLSEGENRLMLLAEDGAGNTERAQSPVLIRKPPARPPLQLEIEGSVWE